MKLGEIAISTIRVGVAALVGLALAYLAKLGLDIDVEVIKVAVDAVVVTGYYAVVRRLEDRFPWVGKLLGFRVNRNDK